MLFKFIRRWWFRPLNAGNIRNFRARVFVEGKNLYFFRMGFLWESFFVSSFWRCLKLIFSMLDLFRCIKNDASPPLVDTFSQMLQCISQWPSARVELAHINDLARCRWTHDRQTAETESAARKSSYANSRWIALQLRPRKVATNLIYYYLHQSQSFTAGRKTRPPV